MSAYGESSDWEEIENVCCVCVYICLDELQYNQADVGLYVRETYIQTSA